jgi:type II secretory pathway component PulJ
MMKVFVISAIFGPVGDAGSGVSHVTRAIESDNPGNTIDQALDFFWDENINGQPREVLDYQVYEITINGEVQEINEQSMVKK